MMLPFVLREKREGNEREKRGCEEGMMLMRRIVDEPFVRLHRHLRSFSFPPLSLSLSNSQSQNW